MRTIAILLLVHLDNKFYYQLLMKLHNRQIFELQTCLTHVTEEVDKMRGTTEGIRVFVELQTLGRVQK